MTDIVLYGGVLALVMLAWGFIGLCYRYTDKLEAAIDDAHTEIWLLTSRIADLEFYVGMNSVEDEDDDDV